MNRRHFSIIAGTSFLSTASLAKALDAKSFEIQIKGGVRLIETWKGLQQRENLWQKQWLRIANIEYDVVRSESVLRPFVGTVRTMVISMFSVKHLDRSEAEAERLTEAVPSLPGGANAYTIEYDLKFEPTDRSWSFMSGKSRTSLQTMFGNQDWIDLRASDVDEGKGVHGLIVKAFATPPDAPKRKAPSVDKARGRAEA